MSRILNMKYIPEIKSELQWFDNLKALICIFASNSCHWRSWFLIGNSSFISIVFWRKKRTFQTDSVASLSVGGIFLVKTTVAFSYWLYSWNHMVEKILWYLQTEVSEGRSFPQLLHSHLKKIKKKTSESNTKSLIKRLGKKLWNRLRPWLVFSST